MADAVRFNGCIEWHGRRLDFSGRTLVAGVLNVTPDSFSDGGLYTDIECAVRRAIEIADEGADVIDIGGQSTRPGSQAVDDDEQMRRILPVIERISDNISAPISVDTTSARVARAALDAGAAIINDISALRDDGDMADLAAERGAPVVLMHMQGTPETMQAAPRYADVVSEIRDFLAERIDHAVAAGVAADRIIVDPGVGFGKTVEHNLAILRNVEAFFALGAPVLIGHSRKRFIKALLGEMIGDRAALRDPATLAVSAILADRGAHMLRVHDVGPTRQAVELAHHLVAPPP